MKARAQLAVGPIGLHVGCPPRPRTRPRCMSGLLLQFLSTPRPFTNWPLARSSSSLHDFCFFMHVPGLTSPALCPETSHEPRLLSAPAFLVATRLQLASPNFTSGHILWQFRRRTLATSLLTYANFLAFSCHRRSSHASPVQQVPKVSAYVSSIDFSHHTTT